MVFARTLFHGILRMQRPGRPVRFAGEEEQGTHAHSDFDSAAGEATGSLALKG